MRVARLSILRPLPALNLQTYMRSGSYANPPALPWTPGNDGAGVIAAIGEVWCGAASLFSLETEVVPG